jgi:predicted Zn-dependent peptidase
MQEIAFRKEVLPSGIVVVAEPVDHVRSFAVGVWVNRGARDEEKLDAGISHFIEHMLFRGTARRAASQIASSLESLGGHLDAFTEREITCYYARAMDEHLEPALDVLSDIVCNSVFDPGQLEREKRVVAEEIKNLEDTPDEVIHDTVASAVWSGHPMGDSILGKIETVSEFTRERLLSAFQERYTRSNVVISAAGRFDFNRLVELIASSFVLPDRDPQPRGDNVPPYSRNDHVEQRPLSQQYLCLCRRSIGYENERRYDLRLLNTILGEGMSSRLFQRVREQAGLAYSVYSYTELYGRTGLFCVFMGVGADKAASCLDVVRSELAALARDGVSQDELDSAKAQLKGGLSLSLESMSARMSRIARSEIYYHRELPLDEIIHRIDRCTVESVTEIAGRIGLGDDDLSLVALGPVSATDLSRG